MSNDKNNDEFVLVEDEPKASRPSRSQKKTSNSKNLNFRLKLRLPPDLRRPALAFLVAIILGAGIYKWLNVESGFPNLSPGSYLGEIRGVFQDKERRPVKFYVEHVPNNDYLFFAILRNGWNPDLINLPAMQSEQNPTSILPITLVAPEGKLRFSGSKVGPSHYKGKVVDLDNRISGTWELNALKLDPAPSEDLLKTRLWLLLRAELSNIELQIADIEKRAPTQRSEIERLSNYITEGEKLKARAQNKFEESKQELLNAQQLFQQKQEEAKQLESQIKLAQRLTAMGKLVTLARESIEREGRWMESMFRSQPDHNSEEVEKQLKEREKVVNLRHQIEIEQARIENLHKAKNGSDYQ